MYESLHTKINERTEKKSPSEKVYFLHLHKCWWSSIRHVLKKEFDSFAPTNLRDQINSVRSGEKWVNSMIEEMVANYGHDAERYILDEFNLYAAHPYMMNFVSSDWFLATTLRNPENQIISHINDYYTKSPRELSSMKGSLRQRKLRLSWTTMNLTQQIWHTLSHREIVHPRFNNNMTRSLLGNTDRYRLPLSRACERLEKMHFVWLQEFHALSMLLLSYKLGVKFDSYDVRVNVASYTFPRLWMKHKTLLALATRYDKKLYRKWQEIFVSDVIDMCSELSYDANDLGPEFCSLLKYI